VTKENTNTWWGYVHKNGTVQAKRYFGPEDISEAEESPFCVEIVGPFEAYDRDDAIAIIKQKLNLN